MLHGSVELDKRQRRNSEAALSRPQDQIGEQIAYPPLDTNIRKICKKLVTAFQIPTLLTKRTLNMKGESVKRGIK